MARSKTTRNELWLVYGVWFILVVAWNYGYAQASPFQDVLVAVLLAVTVYFILNHSGLRLSRNKQRFKLPFSFSGRPKRFR